MTHRRWATWAARGAYLLVLALATLSSIRWDPDPGAVAYRLRRMVTPVISARDAIDAARNVVLFAGWGLVWMLTAAMPRGRSALAAAVGTGAAVSLSVELAQALSWTRRASVLDLFTNTLGALAGAGAVAVAVGLLARRMDGRALAGVPALVFAGSYGLAVLGEALVPLFRQWPLPQASGGPFSRLSLTLSEFDWGSLTTIPTTDLLLFLPAGALATIALVEEGVERGSAAAVTAVTGSVLVATAELAHGALGLPILAGAALLHGAAVVAGAALAAALLPWATRRWWGVERPRILLAAYVLTLLFWMLRPFEPVAGTGVVFRQLTDPWWVPLQSLAERMDVFSVIDVMNGFLLYLPVGALLAVWPLRRRGPLHGVLPAVYLAAATELLQLLVESRTLDITDTLVQAAGAVVGFVLVRRAGFRPAGELA